MTVRMRIWVALGVIELLLPSLVFADSMEDVICLREGTLAVRSDDLRDIIAQVPSRTPVKVFQGWGDEAQQGVVRGKHHDFVRVQFDHKNETLDGWVAKQYVKPESACRKRQPPASRASNGRSPPAANKTGGRGLESPDCCVFPLPVRPKQSYLNGARNFGAGRDEGRKHAACDLKYGDGTPIRAVTFGTVTRSYYRFYKRYNAIEITHADGFVARYAETNSYRAPGIHEGASVDKGQTIGKMGLMLHFELYSGKARGSLTNRERPYSRRSDLIDPTPYLQRWEANL